MTRKEVLAEGVTLYLGDCREILPTLGKIDAEYFDIARRRIQGAIDAPDMFVEPLPPAKQEAFEL